MAEALTAEQAAKMTRSQALRALAAAGDYRAKLMIEGPVITDEEAERLRSFRPKLQPMVAAVRMALWQLGAEIAQERRHATAELRELAGRPL